MKKVFELFFVLLITISTCFSADIKIKWNDPNTLEMGVIRYRVYKSIQSDYPTWVKIGETTNKFYNLTVTNGYYKFRVTALNMWGEGSYTTNSEVGKLIETPLSINNVSITNWVK